MTRSATARTAVAAGFLDVHESGPEDGVPVLLLHGFPQGAECWAEVVPELTAAGFRCVAPDQRGYSPGARPPQRSAYGMDLLVADALAVVDDRVGPGARVHLVGHDWGATVAWRLAARHPGRLRSLSALSVPPPAAYLHAMLTTRQGPASWYVAALQVPGLAERVFAARGRPFSPRLAAMLRRTGQTPERAERDAARLADPAAFTAAVNWYRAMRPRVSAARGRAARDPKVEVPTLFVWSDGDTALTRQSTTGVQQHVSGPYTYAELRGVSHWIPEETPDALADLLLEHWAAYPG